MNVIFFSEVFDDLVSLIPILYENGYFSYEADAVDYVEGLIDDIQTNLPEKRHRPAPKYYDKYGKGMFYASFKKNRRTTWYAFFTKYEADDDTIYLVRYIGNNHTEAHHLYEDFISD
jgi:hypothetical protein